MLSRTILPTFFSRHYSYRRMSHNESKSETIEEQLGLSHIIKFIKMSIEFPSHQQAFVYTDHELICVSEIDQLAI